MNPVRTIWMDGRPHPPAWAPHTWQGFSTGKWEGDMLTVETTHLKPAYVRRNGLARSEKATVREHFIRNGDILTIVTIVNDPVYLTEPYIKSRNFQLDPGYHMTPYPCSVDVEIDRPAGEIPHYLPGTNPSSARRRPSTRCRSSRHAAVPETMYPEYMERMKTLPTATMPPGGGNTGTKRNTRAMRIVFHARRGLSWLRQARASSLRTPPTPAGSNGSGRRPSVGPFSGISTRLSVRAATPTIRSATMACSSSIR
jgi:hypothetical protein